MFVALEEFFHTIGSQPEMQAAYDIISEEVSVWPRTAQEGVTSNGGYETLAKKCKSRCEYHLTDDQSNAVKNRLNELVKRLAMAWRVIPAEPGAVSRGWR
jgi:hypothetical protein